MATARDLMKGGMSAGTAKAMGGQTNMTVSAAGSTQGTATALTATNNFISTAAASSGVLLATEELGSDVWIYNGGANTLTVYPHTGGKINVASTNAGVSLGTNTLMILKRFSSTQWIAIVSA